MIEGGVNDLLGGVEILDEVGDVIIIVVAGLLTHGLGDLFQVGDAIVTEVGDDAGQELLQLLGLGGAGDGVEVRLDRSLDLGVVDEADDITVLLEEVNLLNALDLAAIVLFQELLLHLLVVGAGVLGGGLLGTTDGTGTASSDTAFVEPGYTKLNFQNELNSMKNL